jgi:hypothetical protein
MTNRWDAWKAQDPPADFAARVVAGSLAERSERQRSRRLAAPWTVAAAAMAAVMVAGAAWGLTAWKTRAVSAHKPSAQFVVTTEAVRPVVPPPPPPMASTSTAALTTPPPVVASPPVHRKVETASPPDPGRKVMLPPCACSPHEEMCTCF